MKLFHFVTLTVLAGLCILKSEVHGQPNNSTSLLKIAGVLCEKTANKTFPISAAKCDKGQVQCTPDIPKGTPGALTCSDATAKLTITGCLNNQQPPYFCIAAIPQISCTKGGPALGLANVPIVTCVLQNVESQAICDVKGQAKTPFGTEVTCKDGGQLKFVSVQNSRTVANPCGAGNTKLFCTPP